MQEFQAPAAHEGKSLSSFILAAFAFLLPIFFIPGAIFPFQFSKVMLALVVVVAICVVFSIRTLRSGSFSFTWSWLTLALIILPVLYLISALFSSVPTLSFFGYQLDQDTFGFITLCAALALATTVAATEGRRIFSVLLALLAGATVALLFQLVQIFFGAPIDLDVFSSAVQNVIGKWNDVGLIAGLAASLSLLSLEVLSLSRLWTGLMAAALVISLVVLAIVSFSLAWILLGIVAFLTLVFSVMRRHLGHGGTQGKARGVASSLVIAAVIFFVFFGSPVSSAIQNRFNLQALEVSPSAQGTLGILQGVYAKNALFGSGPNTFVNDWLLLRPAQTLSTVFWSTEFDSGFGFIPSAAATGGIVVVLGWLVLIGFFLYTAIRALLSVSFANEGSYFLMVATALGSAFLFAAHIFYVPSQSLTLLLFLFVGLFIASLKGTPLTRRIHLSFSESPRLGFVSVLGLTVLMVVSLVSLYAAGAVYAGTLFEGQAILRSNAGDATGALAAANQAVAISPQDRYYRTLSSLNLAQLSTLAQSGKTDTATQSAIQGALQDAVANASAALALDPLSYDNWTNRAGVYEAAAQLQIQGASDNARTALEEARKLNPATPEIDYQEATLKAFAKDMAGARTSAQAAVAKKADYTPAILLLAQLSLNEGKLDDAITSLKAAIVFTPQDSSLLYELGVLELQNKQYADAADAFNRAIAITANYANAQFYLGAADVFLGKKDDALALFNALLKDNPDNATLKDVIAKVTSGANPFATPPTTLPPATAPSIQQ